MQFVEKDRQIRTLPPGGLAPTPTGNAGSAPAISIPANRRQVLYLCYMQMSQCLSTTWSQLQLYTVMGVFVEEHPLGEV